MSFDTDLLVAMRDLDVTVTLKQEQMQALAAIYAGKDTLCLLPTSFGKSLIYQLAPYLLGHKTSNPEALTLVISPLNSIMRDQVRKLCQLGVKACYLDMKCTEGSTYQLKKTPQCHSEAEECDQDSDGHITDEDEDETGCEDGCADELTDCSVSLDEVTFGKYRLVYAHPEAFLSTTAGRAMLRSKTFRDNVCCIAIDEGHMTQEWGTTFRTDFSRIQDILAVYPECPAVVLSATASLSTQRKLCDDLSLRDPVMVVVSPDRPNIKYYKKERQKSTLALDDLDDILTEIGENLKRDRLSYPQTILYGTLESIRYSYRHLATFLGTDQYEGDHIPENRIFAQYHSHYTTKMKSHIVAELPKEESKLRVVFATVALGMGLDAPRIRKIIHFGSPTNIEMYLQETGRAGRDGNPSEAILYYNNTDIRSNRPGQKDSMGAFCRSEGQCLRHLLLQHMDFQPPADRPLCTCCQVCQEKECTCDACLVAAFDVAMTSID